ncbi:MAG TPA: hypothetical protein PK490_07475 [Prosthecobacter sp.]|nr:hypothetical protein [Prosthecobacter sp.]
MGETQIFNFYSSGEEVLDAHPQADDPDVLAIGNGTTPLGNPNPLGRYAWALQEKLKGRTSNDWVLGSHSGGWGFSSAYSTNPNFLMVPSPSQTAAITDAQLRAEPFFRAKTFQTVDLDPALFGNQGTQYAHDNRAMLLARAFPVRTLPIGANAVAALGSQSNFDMNQLFKSGWPQSRRVEGRDDWFHSDMREVAYTYIFKMFDKIVNLGGLNR